jgi:D-3-phosphoglycerate dehydrogenase
MKICGIGDLFIPADYIRTGFKKNGLEADVFDWDTGGFAKLQEINLLIEQNGSEAYDVPSSLLDKIKDAEILITQLRFLILRDAMPTP